MDALRYHVTHSGEIQVRNATFEDSGVFTCTAKNLLGIKSVTVSLFVTARPRFRSVPPKSQVAYLGFDTQLSCDIVGYPRPVITWRISNTLLLVNKDRYVLANGTLVIKKTKKSDQGAYVCQAFNNLGSELGAFVLTVKQVEPAKLIDGPPPVTRIARKDDAVRLACSASGDPLPAIQWTKNGTQVRREKILSRVMSRMIKTELVLDSFAPNSSEVYTCAVSADHGTNIMTKAKVEFRTCLDPGSPSHGYRLGSSFWAGETVSFLCETGYTLIGPNAILCLPDGSWTDTTPSCRRRCAEIRTPVNGFTEGNELWEGGKVIFNCLPDYLLHGNKTLTCTSAGTWDSPRPVCRPAEDCASLFKARQTASGSYLIDPDGAGFFAVSCDMKTDGGGWTVFQRRYSGAVNFFRNWADYKHGFGPTFGEFWLGNDYIHRLTARKDVVLRVELADWSGNTALAKYGIFRVADKGSKYRLSVGSYSGTAGDSMAHHNGRAFSTKDQDNDDYGGHCAQSYTGAWWYGNCHDSNLNGKYLGAISGDKGMRWAYWKSSLSLKTTEMKIRPVSFKP